jgi:hypothetical protein
VRALAIAYQDGKAQRKNRDGIGAPGYQEQVGRRNHRGGHSRQPGHPSRAAQRAHQQVHSRNADAIEESGIEMIGARFGHRIEFSQRRRPISQRGRIDVIETRAAVPERLPERVRPVLFEETRVGDEGALDGRPFVEVLGLEQRPNQHRRQQENEEEITADPRADAWGWSGPHAPLYRRSRLWNCLWRRSPERCVRYFARTHRIERP